MFKLYRPSSTPDPTFPFVVYPSSLFSLGLGYALWYPEPHETGESQIGDVGYVNDGAFIRLFNINDSKPEHQVTFWHTPFKITNPLPGSENVFRPNKQHRAIDDGPYLSRGVQEKETHGSISVSAFADTAASLSAGYSCKESQGALLVLQSQGHSEAAFAGRKLKAHMVRQHEQWCNYVRDELGHDVSSEDVVLISGWVKTSADWAATTFSNLVSRHYASLQGKAGRFVGLELFRSRTRALSGPKMHRQGSKYSRSKGKKRAEMDQDQSIFLKRYKLKRRLVILKAIVAGAGYDRLPDHDRGGAAGEGLTVRARVPDEDEDNEGEGLQWLQNKVVDPLDILLEYILEVSDAEIAIACDADIQGILGMEDWPIDFATYLRRVRPPVDVEDQCGTISIHKLLASERVQKLERRFVTVSDLRRWPKISYGGAGIPSMAPVKFTDNPDDDSSPSVPTKWPYIEFLDPSTANDTLSVTAFAASPDGKLLAAIEGTLGIVVWRLSDGLTVRRLGQQGHTAPICALAFSPDGRSIVSGSADTTAIVWDIQTGLPVSHLQGHREPVDRVTYTLDGSLIVTASSDVAELKFWGARSGMPLCTFHLRWRIDGFLLSQQSSKLAVRMQRGVALYEAGSRGPIVQLGVLNAPHSEKIAAIALSPDGDRLFISDYDSNTHIYNSDTCKALVELEEIGTKSAAFSSDGAKLATVTLDALIYIWDSRRGQLQLQRTVGRPATAVAFSPNGAFLAAAGGVDGPGSVIRVWDWESRDLLVEFTAPAKEIEDIKFLPDSRSLLTFTKQRGPVYLWNVVDVLRLR